MSSSRRDHRRAATARSGRRRVVVWTAAAIMVLAAAIAATVLLWPRVALPKSDRIDASTGAISIGEGAHAVDVYLDFHCPVCAQFDELYVPVIDDAVTQGVATLRVHPVAVLDRASGGAEYSTRAANAAYCVAVADADAVLPFVSELMTHQPDSGTALTDANLIRAAANVGATGVDDCVTERTYAAFVADTTARAQSEWGGELTPPVLVIDGETVAITGDPAADVTARLG